MTDRLRIYSFGVNEVASIFSGRLGPDAATWPDDAVVRDIWVQRRSNPVTLSVKVSHDSFAPVDEGAMIPGFICGLVARRES